jgi:hypothetical protein
MLRKVSLAVIVTALGLGAAAQARADHDRELKYLVGGAIVGAAIGSLAYRSRHAHPAPYYGPEVYVSYGAGYRPYPYPAYAKRPYRPRWCDHPRHRRFDRHWHD